MLHVLGVSLQDRLKRSGRITRRGLGVTRNRKLSINNLRAKFFGNIPLLSDGALFERDLLFRNKIPPFPRGFGGKVFVIGILDHLASKTFLA